MRIKIAAICYMDFAAMVYHHDNFLWDMLVMGRQEAYAGNGRTPFDNEDTMNVQRVDEISNEERLREMQRQAARGQMLKEFQDTQWALSLACPTGLNHILERIHAFLHPYHPHDERKRQKVYS